jgi:hypothetical protein
MWRPIGKVIDPLSLLHATCSLIYGELEGCGGQSGR